MRFSYSKIVAQSLSRLLDYLKLNGNPVNYGKCYQNNFAVNNRASKFLLYLLGTFSLDAVSKTNTNPIHSVFAKCDQY